jgi:hypothetical protein
MWIRGLPRACSFSSLLALPILLHIFLEIEQCRLFLSSLESLGNNGDLLGLSRQSYSSDL